MNCNGNGVCQRFVAERITEAARDAFWEALELPSAGLLAAAKPRMSAYLEPAVGDHYMEAVIKGVKRFVCLSVQAAAARQSPVTPEVVGTIIKDADSFIWFLTTPVEIKNNLLYLHDRGLLPVLQPRILKALTEGLRRTTPEASKAAKREAILYYLVTCPCPTSWPGQAEPHESAASAVYAAAASANGARREDPQ